LGYVLLSAISPDKFPNGIVAKATAEFYPECHRVKTS